jgi:hypothetical protein
MMSKILETNIKNLIVASAFALLMTGNLFASWNRQCDIKYNSTGRICELSFLSGPGGTELCISLASSLKDKHAPSYLQNLQRHLANAGCSVTVDNHIDTLSITIPVQEPSKVDICLNIINEVIGIHPPAIFHQMKEDGHAALEVCLEPVPISTSNDLPDYKKDAPPPFTAEEICPGWGKWWESEKDYSEF